MHALQSVLLRLQLYKIRDPVSCIQTAVLIGLVTNFQQIVHLLLVDSHASSDLREPFVCVVARLVDDVCVKEVLLLFKEFLAEVVELVRLHLEHGKAGFVHECRGRVPGLDLLAEDCDNAVRVFVEERLAQRRAVDGFEELGTEGADVVKVCNMSGRN